MRRSITWVVLVAALSVAAQLRTLTVFTADFDRNRLSVTDTVGGNETFYSYLSYDELYHGDEAGVPALPVRYVRLLVPTGVSDFSLQVASGSPVSIGVPHTIYPVQPPVPIGEEPIAVPFIPPNAASYASSSHQFPDNLVKIVGEGYLHGDQHIVTLAVYPCRYYPQENRIDFYSSISITLNYQNGSSRSVSGGGLQPISREGLLSVEDVKKMSDLVDNKGDVSVLLPSISSRGIVVKPLPDLYYVVTNRTLAPAFERLIGWKRQKGLQAKIIIVEDILSNSSIVEDSASPGLMDAAAKLREYLRRLYSMTTKTQKMFVLLGGGDGVVPYRYGAGNDNSWNYLGQYAKIPTDLYYSDLTGNWNVDGDEFLGEELGDHVDYEPEIYVGRLQCKTAEEINNYTDKLLIYEQNPGKGDFSYLKKAFHVQADEMQRETNALTAKNLLLSLGFNSIIIEEKDGYATFNTWYPKGKEVIDEMKKQYGFFSWYLHGNPSAARTAFYDGGVGKVTPKYGITSLDRYKNNFEEEVGNGLDCLNNADYPGVVYTISCDQVPYDRFEMDISVLYDMGQSFTLGKDYGGVAYLANTRVGWIGPSLELQKEFTKQILAGEYSLGITEAQSKTIYMDWKHHWLALTHNLIGCPELKMWTDIPRLLTNVVANQSGTTLAVDIGTDSCRIALAGIGSNDLQVANGRTAIFTSVPANYTLVITKDNYIPYIAPVYLQNATLTGKSYLDAGSAYLGGNATPNKTTGPVVLDSGSELIIESSGEEVLDKEIEVKVGGILEIK